MGTEIFIAAFLQGAFVMAGLIMALGPQNILAVKFSLGGERHARDLIAFFVLSDALLVILGVLFATSSIALFNSFPSWLVFTAVAYLSWHGLNALQSAFTLKEPEKVANKMEVTSLLETLLLGSAVTFLNPGVYLDTLGLIGGLSAQHQPAHWALASGAIFTSCVWFTGIFLIGKLQLQFFLSGRFWQVLEGVAGVTLLTLAWSVFSNSSI